MAHENSEGYTHLLADIQHRSIESWSDFARVTRALRQQYLNAAANLTQRQRQEPMASQWQARANLADRAHLGGMVAAHEARGGDFGAMSKLGQRLEEALLLGIIPAQFVASAVAITELETRIVPIHKGMALPALEGAHDEELPKLIGAVRFFEESVAKSRCFVGQSRNVALPNTQTLLNLAEWRLGSISSGARATLTQACLHTAMPS